MKRNFFLCLIFIGTFCFQSCKKKPSDPYYIREKINGRSFSNCGAGGELVVSSNLIEAYPALQTCDAGYNIALIFKKEFGVQVNDTSQSSANIICYTFGTYSTYCAGTNATISVTEIDTVHQTIKGTFFGNLCEQDTSNETLQITDGEFYFKYQSR